MGEALGRLFYHLDKRHRLVALDNLQKVWGKEKSSRELTQIAQGVFRNLGRSLVEFCRMSKIDEHNIEQFVEIEGWDNFENAKQSGKGILITTAHFGNWEMIPQALAFKGQPLNSIVRPLDNIYLDQLVTRIRTGFGSRIIPKKNALRGILRSLRRGENIGILMDQSTASNEAVLAKFFGYPCYTLTTPVVLALKTGCRIIPLFITRCSDNRHKMVIHPPFELIRSDNYQQDLLTNIQALNDIIEQQVTQHPDHWLWIHRRWKF